MIVSRELKKEQELIRGEEILVVKNIVKEGRTTIAEVKNSKNKIERLSITDLWKQKVEIKGKEKKKEKKIDVEQKMLSLSLRPQSGGTSFLFKKENGTIICGSWQRKS